MPFRPARLARHAYRRLRAAAEPFGEWVTVDRMPSLVHRARTYAAIRKEGGVGVAHDGSALVASYAVLRDVLRDDHAFSRAWSAGVNPDMGGLDGDAHAPFRAAMTPAFSRQALDGRGGWVRSVARSTLEAMAARGERDLTAGFAEPYAFRIAADMFGLGHVETDRVLSWVPHLWAITGAGAGGAAGPVRDFRAAAREAYQTAAEGAGEDGLAALAAVPRAVASPEAFERSLAGMVLAGGPTVRFATYELLRALIDHPETGVREDRSRRPAFIDETLRLAPVLMLKREATRDVVLGGRAVPRGTRVYGLLEPVNRDPAVFADADAFRPGRPERHLAFGHGPHFCPGHLLAREELEGALDVVLDVWPSLRDAVDAPTRRAGPVLGRSNGPLRLRRPPPL